MKKIIENLRNKPDHVKSRYVIVLSAIATVVVVVVWITTTALLKTSDNTIKTDGPIKIFSNLFKSGVSTTAKDYKANKEAFNASLQASDQTSVTDTATSGVETVDTSTPTESAPQ